MVDKFDIRVMHITETIKGGVATYLNEIYASQEEFVGQENLFFTSPDDSVDQLSFFVPKEFQFNSKGKRSLRYFFRYYKFISRVINRVNPDVVHVHGTFSGLFSRVHKILNFKRHKIIYSPHGWSFLMDVGKVRKIIYFIIEYLLQFFLYKAISNSKNEYNFSINNGISVKRSELIYNAIGSDILCYDNHDIAKIDNDKINLLFVGRFDFAKGLDLLLDAFNSLDNNKYFLHIAGCSVNGDLSIKLTNSKNIECYGWLNAGELSNLYRQVDVVVIPSRSEGFGYVALEAMKYSKAVIASRRGALPELVIDTYNGYLFDINNIEALKEIILRLSKDSLRVMGEYGYKLFQEKFSSREMNEKTLNLYIQALGFDVGLRVI